MLANIKTTCGCNVVAGVVVVVWRQSQQLVALLFDTPLHYSKLAHGNLCTVESIRSPSIDAIPLPLVAGGNHAASHNCNNRICFLNRMEELAYYLLDR